MYHVPVMLQECLEGLNISPEKVYVDVTFGGGGHSKAILDKLTTGKLIAFDQDQDAKLNADAMNDENLIFVASNFRNLKRYLKLHGHPQVDGILADLGISSHQIDKVERGFSTRGDFELDMRMNQGTGISAKDVINDYDETQLRKIFKLYGELKNFGKVAATIVRERNNRDINTTGDLMNVLSNCAPRGKENKYFAQLFQAIRIEVNDELTVLEEMLQQASDVLRPSGRLVVMSYHSLEDRLVKNFIKTGNFEGKQEKDFYGNLIRPLKPVTGKPVIATEEEIGTNRRARSAKLRIAEKI
ncbi:16S rRNA (cytosine(1402)-N(4))-methyltransferase RsmH [Limibacter armeniacum]|uniref:16S rRNA (cytosine(1402)-N(4))-methyltransferase RsmH n=1 Tax=Limibacter armeniacum TaxID=466084 RepID=UPI002FE6395A